MRFESLALTAYGPLAGREFDLRADAVVVFGRNEAGKSSFHGALETALFGFEPGRRDRHPLGQWDPEGPAPSLVASLRPEDGSRVWIRRELLPTTSAFQRGSRNGEWSQSPRLADTPLAEVQSVTRELYRAVYSLTAGGAIELKDSVREQVTTLLCGELGVPGALPLRELHAQLAKESARLWRPDRHRTQAKEAVERIAELQATRRKAGAADRIRREEVRELEALKAELDSTRSALMEARRACRHARFAEAWNELAALQAERVELHASALEGESMEDPALLQREADAREVDLDGPRQRLARAPIALNATEKAILQSAADIRLAAHEAANADLDRERMGSAERLVREHSANARRALIDAGLPDQDPARLDELPLGAWTAEARAWQDAQAGSTRRLRNGPGRHASLLALTMTASGLVLAALAGLGYLPIASLWFGLLLLVLSVVAALVESRSAPEANPRPDAAEAAALALGAGSASAPHVLLRQLEAAQLAREAADQSAEAAQVLAECRDRERARHEHWRTLSDTLLPGSTTGRDASTLPVSLAEALDAAQHREQAAREDSAERGQQEARLEERSRRHAAACRRLRRARLALAATFGEDLPVQEAYRRWQDQLELHGLLRATEKRLRNDPLWKEVTADTPEAHLRLKRSQPLAQLQDRVDDLEAREREVLESHSRLSERLSHRPSTTVGEIDGSLLAAREELEDLHLQHDQLALLQQLLLVAERSYREEHQPDVLERAGRYLASISEGRYTRLSYPLGDDGPLHVESAQLGRAVPVDAPLSRGIQEQIYLCLRLGTLDHLDAGRTRLPLVLDEALIHWDKGRRTALYPVLAELAPQRQVILFTCHPELAKEAVEGMQAVRIDLSKS